MEKYVVYLATYEDGSSEVTGPLYDAHYFIDDTLEGHIGDIQVETFSFVKLYDAYAFIKEIKSGRGIA